MVLVPLPQEYLGGRPAIYRRVIRRQHLLAVVGCLPLVLVGAAGSVAYGVHLARGGSVSDGIALALCAVATLFLGEIFLVVWRHEPTASIEPYFERAVGGDRVSWSGGELFRSLCLIDRTAERIDEPTLSSYCYVDDGRGDPPEWFEPAAGLKVVRALREQLNHGPGEARGAARRAVEDLDRLILRLELAEQQGIRFCLMARSLIRESGSGGRAGSFQ